MHAKDLISTWPILTLTGFLMDSLHTYIVCGGTYSLILLTPRHWAAVLSTCTTGGSSAARLCMPLNHSLHMPTRYNGRRAVDRAWRRRRGCPVIPLVESQL